MSENNKYSSETTVNNGTTQTESSIPNPVSIIIPMKVATFDTLKMMFVKEITFKTTYKEVI